ncbi:hypothetical protein ACLKA6_004514 [Drosophila palustris]
MRSLVRQGLLWKPCYCKDFDPCYSKKLLVFAMAKLTTWSLLRYASWRTQVIPPEELITFMVESEVNWTGVSNLVIRIQRDLRRCEAERRMMETA